jgi:RNA polymerase sigma factor (sigma-70 family)
VHAQTDVALIKNAADSAGFDFEATFVSAYGPVARLVARVIRDPGRAEELAVEAFWRLWNTPAAQGDSASGWLRRTAVRLAIDELRRRARRERYERLMAFGRAPRTPDELFLSTEEQGRVRAVLAVIPRRQAELLLLRSDDASYEELAATLSINSRSVGVMLSRAKQTFRKAYVKRYGTQF